MRRSTSPQRSNSPDSRTSSALSGKSTTPPPPKSSTPAKRPTPCTALSAQYATDSPARRPYGPPTSTSAPDQVLRHSICAGRDVHGHEKVPVCGQVEVPGGGQVKVPIPRSSCRPGG